MGYVTGGDHGEHFPATPTTFVNPALPGAWITASDHLTESGKVESITVHLDDGTDVRAKRVSDTPDTPP